MTCKTSTWSLQRSKEVLSDINATGIAMLFSGGTFLYVATVHILPELARFGVQTQTALPDTVISVHEHRGFSKTELVVMVIGCILPLVLALGHRHQIEVESLRISAFSWHSVAGRLDENDLVIIRQKSQLRNLNNIAYNLLWFVVSKTKEYVISCKSHYLSVTVRGQLLLRPILINTGQSLDTPYSTTQGAITMTGNVTSVSYWFTLIPHTFHCCRPVTVWAYSWNHVKLYPSTL